MFTSSRHTFGIRGDQNQAPLAELKEPELKDYLLGHFEFLRGETDLETRIIEQNYVALFIRGNEMRRRRLDIRLGKNSASVSFEHQ
jgi:hypothetical protein